MSLSSLADAPLLPKPAGVAGLSILRSRSLARPVTKLKEDQASIDALFQDDAGTQVEKTHAERKGNSPSREPLSSARKFELQSNPAETVPLPALLSLNQQTGDFSKKRQTKQDDGLFSKTRDASDVLAGFLAADSTSDMNSNKLSHLEDINKDQREDFKSKWNSYSPQPLGRLPPTLTNSSRLASASTLSTPDSLEPSISLTKVTSNSLSFLTKDEKWDSREDVLSLLPDESNKSGNKGAISENLCYDPSTSCQNVDEETLDFGAYQPSCLSMPAPTQTLQRRHLTKFFPSSEIFNEKEIKMGVAEKQETGLPSSKMVENVSDEIDMLKNMQTVELQRREKQLCMEKDLLAERKGAMDSFSQLLLKADEWSAKIDELHKSMVCEKVTEPTERSDWIANIESTVSEHESSLQVMEKRSTEVCNQLEKVAIMLDNARKDMERLQQQEEQRINSSHDQQQASQEKKDLDIQRETVLCMKEQISQADATLRKQLHDHSVRMQAEVEEMTRQKRELEHARNIAAEIALEVENSRRELAMYKTTFSETTLEAPGKGPSTEDSLIAQLAAQHVPNFGRKLERSRHELYRRPYSSADVHARSFYGMDLLETSKSLRSENAMLQEVQEGMHYIRDQEEFLIQAEKALEGMSFNEMCIPLANF